MTDRQPLVHDGAGQSKDLGSDRLLIGGEGIRELTGRQNTGGFVQPGDVFSDYVVQGFLTPTGVGLTGTMSTVAWPGGINCAIAFATKHRVFKEVGDPSLTFTYTASRDTYDDISYDGTITHVEVANGAGEPAVTANSLRLQKVVTNATDITSVTQLAPTNPLFAGLIPKGNILWVDAVNGNDLTAIRGIETRPYKTLEAAISDALSGDLISMLPGIFVLSGGITIPAGVTVRGSAVATTSIHLLNVTADTVFITMSDNSRLEDVHGLLTSAQHVNLTGILFPGNTSTSAKFRTATLVVDNSGAGDAGSSNVYGIHSSGTGQPGREVSGLRALTVTVKSSGQGTKRGFLSDSANKFHMRDSNMVCRRTGAGTGSYIGIETNHASTVVECRSCFAEGTSADISQTLGTLLYGGTLANGTTNNTQVDSANVLPFMIWADDGGVPSGATRYMRPGTGALSIAPIEVRLPQSGTANSLSLKAVTAPGSGKTDTVTVLKNGVATSLVATLSNLETEKVSTQSVAFAAGDKMSIQIDTAVASAVSDLVAIVDFIK